MFIGKDVFILSERFLVATISANAFQSIIERNSKVLIGFGVLT